MCRSVATKGVKFCKPALGASEVWDIDQSNAFLEQAETLPIISGHPARFIAADIYETHPMLEMFDPAVANPFRPTFSYFRSEAILETAAITYDGSDHGVAPETHWFIHTISAIVQSCLNAKLTLIGLQEFPHSIREVDYDIYADQTAQVPMSYLLSATKQ